MRDDEKQEHYELAERLLSEQNFVAAIIAGAIATLLSAVAYGIIVRLVPISYGFAAAGVGVFVGFFVGYLGRGISTKFSVLAVGYTIAGCVLGNLFVKIMGLAQATRTHPVDVLRSSSLAELAQWSVAGLTLIHFVFWFVAVFAAGFLAKRSLSRQDRLAIGLYEARN